MRGLLDEQWVERKLLRAVGRIPGPAVEWWRSQELGDRTSEGKGAKQYPPAFLSLAFQLITKTLLLSHWREACVSRWRDWWVVCIYILI